MSTSEKINRGNRASEQGMEALRRLTRQREVIEEVIKILDPVEDPRAVKARWMLADLPSV